MTEIIDELKPIKEASDEAKQVFKRVVQLEYEELYRENPPLEEEVINIIRDAIK